jgi:hypothetical protein
LADKSNKSRQTKQAWALSHTHTSSQSNTQFNLKKYNKEMLLDAGKERHAWGEMQHYML